MPDFIVIGAAKAATSSLCVSLQYHPDIHIPSRKELNFFSIDEVYARGVDWYERQFQPQAGAIIGEGSVTYTFYDAYPNTSRRIHEYNPEMRLIYIVREPVSRVISLYRQFQAAGTIGPGSLQQALDTHVSLLDSARYWKQISAYRNHFPDAQIHVVFFDDWISDPQSVVRRCCEFLGVRSDVELPVSQKGQTQGQLQDSQFLWQLRNMRGFCALRDLVPDGIRDFIRPFVKTPIGGVPELTDETYRLLINTLSSDLCQFLEFYGRPDLWHLDRDCRPSVAA